MTKANIGNSQAVIKIGRNTVLKAYRGSNVLYNPISAPTSPTNVVVSISGKDAIISFSASSSNGGSAITNYIVQYSSNNGNSWTTFNRANSTATSNITVNTLSYSRSYIFRVIAVNNVGSSSPSNSSSSITTPPGIVGNLYGQFKRGGQPSDAEMLAGNFLSTPLSSPSLYSSIDYGENDDNYGFMAIGYFIPPTTGTYTFYTSSDDGSAVWIGSVAEATSGRSSSNMVVNNDVTGYQGDTERSGSISLIAGTVYAVRIIHREGDGGDNLRFSWAGPNISKRTSLATYFYANNFGSAPPAILSVSVDPLNSYLRITPVLSSSNVTYFTISYSSNNGNSWTVFGNGQTAYASSVDITGLTNGVNYKIKITATNSIGTSEEYITENYSPSANGISPLSLANGFLSTLGNDTVNEIEFPNAALSNGYLDVLRLENTSEGEFPNAVLSNGYLDILRLENTPENEFPNAVLSNGYLDVVRIDPIAVVGTLSILRNTNPSNGPHYVAGAGTLANPYFYQRGGYVGGEPPVFRVVGTLNITFVFPDTVKIYKGTNPVTESIVSFVDDPRINTLNQQTVAAVGGTVIASGRNTTVTVSVTDRYLKVRTSADPWVWFPAADNPEGTENIYPSVRIYVS